MLFNSVEFIFIFLPFTVFSYWFMMRTLGPGAATVGLAVLSYWFYWRNEPNYPFLLAVSIALNFGFGLLISRAPEPLRRVSAFVGVFLDLSILAFFKYSHFIVENLSAVGFYHGAIPDLPLPAGISFYTFTQIAFLVDAYVGKVKTYGFGPYCLFVTLFPHLIAGPILHHKEMVRQFSAKKPLSLANHLLAGLVIFSIGLAKKTIIADSVSPAATAIFSSAHAGHAPGLIEAWTGALAYTVQIYFDFSGYCDMAIGISLMMGIRLPINFNSPYQAVSMVDFWRRWHITLSRFLREYLYIALGGNRRGSIRRYLNLLTTMALGGLWHGASWTFVVWGLAHGIGLIVVHAWERIRKQRSIPALPRPLAMLATFTAATVFWVPFRADSFGSMWRLWAGMIGYNGFALPNLGSLARIGAKFHVSLVEVPFGGWDLLAIGLGLAIAWFAPNTQQIMARYRPGLESEGYSSLGLAGRWSIKLRPVPVAAFGLMFGVAIAMISPNSEFIYFRF